MRRLATYLIAIPLAGLGSLFAHQVGYWSTSPTQQVQALALTSTGHGWMRYWPVVVGALVAAVVAGVVVEFARLLRGAASGGDIRAWPFALIAPMGFVAQEVIERVVHGTFEPSFVLQATFVAGLLLQAPIAVATWRLARAVLSAVRNVVLELQRRQEQFQHRADAPAPRPALLLLAAPRGGALLSVHAERAPPCVSLT